MTTDTLQTLRKKRCVPCEGGVPPISPPDIARLLSELPGWEVHSEGTAISKKWTVNNFVAGMRFLDQVAQVAEAEQHHPDVHLTGYRHVRIDLSTHAIGGLSENDFILAAKIDELPVELKKN